MSKAYPVKLRKDVEEKLVTVREMAGKVYIDDIAKAVGWSPNTLRSRACMSGISLRCKESSKRMQRTFTGHQNKRETLRAVEEVDKLWKIPKRCFHQAHMGNFT